MKPAVTTIILEPVDPKYLDRQNPITEATAIIKAIDGKSVLFLYPLPASSRDVLVAGEEIETWRIVHVRRSWHKPKAVAAYRHSRPTLGVHLDTSL